MASPIRRRALLWALLPILVVLNAFSWLREPLAWTGRDDLRDEHATPTSGDDWRWREYWRAPDAEWGARLERGEVPLFAVSHLTGAPLENAEAWIRKRAAFPSDTTVADLCALPGVPADASANSEGIVWLRPPVGSSSDEFVVTLHALERDETLAAYAFPPFRFFKDSPKARAGLAMKVALIPSSRLETIAEHSGFALLDVTADSEPPFVRVVDGDGAPIRRVHIYAGALNGSSEEKWSWEAASTDSQGYAPAPIGFDWRRDYELFLEHPWFLRVAPRWSAAAGQPTKIIMSKGCRVSGQVLFSDDLWHASVHVVLADRPPSDEHELRLEDAAGDLMPTDHCATNPQGYFDCGPFPSGEHDLELRVGGIPFGRVESVALEAGCTAAPHAFQRLDLRHCAAMRLLPGDLPKGTSIEDVSIHVELQDGRLVAASSRFLTLPSDTRRIWVQAPGCKDVWLDPVDGPLRLNLALAVD